MQDTRKDRARQQYLDMRVLPLPGPGRYRVETKATSYTVDLNTQSCSCPDHQNRGSKCKHIWRVELDEDLQTKARQAPHNALGTWRPTTQYVWF